MKNYRIYTFLIFALFCISAIGQHKIISVEYVSPTSAVLTRNVPPPGVIYYWQGTICSNNPTNSALTYTAHTSSTYYLNAYYSSSDIWSTSCASTIVFFPDVTAPILVTVTVGPIEPGTDISVTTNEDGMVYLVPNGTTGDLSGIHAAKVAEASVTEYVASTLTTTGLALGEYVVFAVDGSDNVSTSSGVIELADLTAPILSGVSTGPITIGDAVSATSNEDGMLYLVPAGTASTTGAITSAKVSEATATAGTAVSLATTGISAGSYIVYAIDGSDNVSLASAAIAINAASGDALNTLQAASVVIYPPYVEDILNIKSEIQVSSVYVYSMNGTLVMTINNPSDQINMSGLNEGIYIIKVHLSDKSTFAGKVIKN